MSETYRSPLLDLHGAVEADPPDAGVAAHYGSIAGEQRRLVAGEGFVDLSHRDVISISGPDRLTWLHALTTQHVEHLAPGEPTELLLLSPQGRIEHGFSGVDDGETFLAHTEPGGAPALVAFLDSMRFMTRVEVAGRERRARGRRPARPDLAAATARVPRRPFPTSSARRWAHGPGRRCASRPASAGSASTPTSAPSPTRPACSGEPSISRRAATAVRRRWPGCTRSDVRRGASCCCTSTARSTTCRPTAPT